MKPFAEPLAQVMAQDGQLKTVHFLFLSPNQGRRPSSIHSSPTGGILGLPGLCSQGLDHILCVYLGLRPSIKLPSKETYHALYIRRTWCPTPTPLLNQFQTVILHAWAKGS